jgi:1-acyl-sn-glycerol-3-phosphate acyltransferase
VRRLFSMTVLLAVKWASQLLFRVRLTWVGEAPPGDPWARIRIVAILNHTSLYEPIFAGGAPVRFLRRIAEHGVIPIADKTLARPVVGRFFASLAAHVVALSRQRDHTWREVLAKIHDPKAMVAILPEGRMKRANGLDKEGRPMTVRAGIADLLLAVPDGRMLLAYSEGLHHVQVPGERFPRLFRTVRMRLESIDVAACRDALLARHGERGFHQAVIDDLTRRRDLYCAADWRERLGAAAALQRPDLEAAAGSRAPRSVAGSESTRAVLDEPSV